MSDWIPIADAAECPPGASIERWAGNRMVAVANVDGTFHAIDGLCPHQGGPLGTGALCGAILTCPWHGYQYRPQDGCSPAPFTERVATYATRVTPGIVFVHPRPLKPGTPVAPSVIDTAREAQHGKA